MLKYVGYVKLLVNKSDNLWFVGTMYIGTTHGGEYMTGFRVPRARIWKNAYLARMPVRYQNCQWVRGCAVALKFYAVSRVMKVLGIINSLTSDEAVFVHKCSNWSKAKNWAEWWLRPEHL